MNEDALIISNKFRLVDREVERLSAKISLQKGAWFFKQHNYSIQNLLESEHYDKIYAISEKIGDDVLHWLQSGTLTEEGLEAYKKERDGVQRKLRSLNKEIQERVPTIWENLLSVLEDFVVIVMRVLPTFAKLLKIGALYLGLDASKLLGTGKSIKFLPQAKDEDEA